MALYLTDHAGKLKTATLGRRLVAIARGHRLKGHHLDLRHPAVRETWAGIRRAHGTAPVQKAPVLTADLRAMLASLPVPDAPGVPRLRALRDRAILLVGFASALRRSELAALEMADLAFTGEGVSLRIRRSKTDQEGAGAEVGVPLGNGETCPVAALRAWLAACGASAGPVFRAVLPNGRPTDAPLDGRSIAEVVKRAARRIGRDPAGFGGHSLRAGFATSAAAAGAQLVDIMQQTRHRSEAVARGYIRKGNLFRNRAARALGL